MPRRKAHVEVGVPAGVVVWAVTADPRRDLASNLIEALGAGSGGWFSARLPDVLEPALSPLHRSLFHSVTTGIGTFTLAVSKMKSWQEFCRAKADEHQMLGRTKTDFLSQLFHGLAALLWTFLAGFVAGFTGGYLSHLILDGTTSPLPILV